MKIYNWGIIGTGHISQSFANALLQLPNAKIVAVCSRTKQAAESFAEKFGCESVYTDASELAADESIDVIYVGTPHPFHIDATVAGLLAKKPVLCEKPFAMNMEQANLAISLARENGTFLMEALWTRFLPAYKKAEEWIAAGMIGEVHEIQASFCLEQKNPDLNGRLFNPQLGGGALLDIGLYPVFIIQQLLGGCPDSIETTMERASTGVDASFTAVFHYPNKKKAYISSNFDHRGHHATIIGSLGYITIPDLCCAHSAYSFVGGELYASFNQPLEHGLKYEAAHVMECLEQNLTESPLYPLSATVNELTTLDKIREMWGLTYPNEHRTISVCVGGERGEASAEVNSADITSTQVNSTEASLLPLSNLHDWYKDAVFYHIYPLGFCGALYRNDFVSEPQHGILKVKEYSNRIAELGTNAVYFGPVCESSYHGYDTADYGRIDRRLGTEDDFADVCQTLHGKGIRVIIDGVFNHTGRDFWAFRDVREKRQGSPYCSWFNLNFGGNSNYNDGFWYEGWEGNYDLVKLNLRNPAVKEHIFGCVKGWYDRFKIDGLRLDVAYLLDRDFLCELRAFCKALSPQFFLLGECLHGDYNMWCNGSMLDSVTNYEVYKGLHSSINSGNMFEIAYSLNRQFGPEQWTIYKGLPLYTFADNHDVSRIASLLKNPETVPLIYSLLASIPGIPSVYYGSEFALKGEKSSGDEVLRPSVEDVLTPAALTSALPQYISALCGARRQSKALCRGSYRQLHVSSCQLVFEREFEGERVICAFNIDSVPATLHFNANAGRAKDLITGADIDFGGGLSLPAYTAYIGLVY